MPDIWRPRVIMKTRLMNFWEMLRASYWFLPTLLAGGAILLAPALITLDQALQYGATEGVVWIYTGGPEGASGPDAPG